MAGAAYQWVSNAHADRVPNLGKRNVVSLLALAGCSAVQGGEGSLNFRWAREEDALGHAKTRCLMTTARCGT